MLYWQYRGSASNQDWFLNRGMCETCPFIQLDAHTRMYGCTGVEILGGGGGVGVSHMSSERYVEILSEVKIHIVWANVGQIV